MSAEDVMGPGPDVIIYQWAPQLDRAVGVASQPNSRRSVDRSKRDEPVDAIIPVWAPALWRTALVLLDSRAQRKWGLVSKTAAQPFIGPDRAGLQAMLAQMTG